MTELKLKDVFPHEKLREGQEEFVNDIELAFNEHKTLLAHAPTGLGKTASALAVAVKRAISENKKIFFLTNRHTQHKIAVDTLKEMQKKNNLLVPCVDLIGKRWMCNQPISGLFGNEFNEYCKTIVEKGECEFYNNVWKKRDLQVEAEVLIKELLNHGPLHNSQLVSRSQEKRMCSYEVALALAKKAKVIIGDYYYLFNPFIRNNILKKLNVELEDCIVIVDEGHNLPKRVTEMLSCNLTTNMLKNAVMEAKKFGYHGLISWLQDLTRVVNELGNFVGNDKEKLLKKKDLVDKINLFVEYDELINQLELAADEVRKKQRKSFLGGISYFLDEWNKEDLFFTKTVSEKEGKYGTLTILSHLCLDPSVVTKEVFSRLDSAVIMSGTLEPTFMYKDILGIEKSLERSYKSPFPVENKLTLVIPETSTKYTLRGDSMYQKIAARCGEISNLIEGNVALFFPSYYLRDQVGKLISTEKKLFWEKSSMSKEEKDLFLEQFKAEKVKGGVLLGVSGANFAEGVDFPGDLLNGVVVVGLPLAKPDLTKRETIRYYEEKFSKGWDYGYIYPAMSKIIQSAGRCIRSETDRGVVVFLDERFVWKRYFDCFPDKVGLIVTKNYTGLIKNFFDTTN